MTLSAVATRYANALADVVTAGASPVRPQDAVSELRAFAAALGASTELQNALVTPAVLSPTSKLLIAGLTEALPSLRSDDAEIYIPAIKRIADPQLFPFGSEFFIKVA